MALVAGGNGDSCVLMLHAEGDDGGQTFVDDCHGGTVKTLTAIGAAQHSWNEQKFGESALYCDGGGAYLQVDASNDFRFAEQDWTVDFWGKCPAVGGMPQAGNAYFFCWYEDYDNYFGLERVASAGATTKFRARYVLAGIEIFNAAMSTYVDVSSWVHLEITRVGDTVRLFVGGVLKATGTADDTDFAANFDEWTLYVGASLLGGQSGLKSLIGYVDEFRILRGEAAHTGPFTPWSNAYSRPNTCHLRGTHLIHRSVECHMRGTHGILHQPSTCHMRGQHMILRGHEAHVRGTHTVETGWECHMRGAHNILLQEQTCHMRGAHKILRSHEAHMRGAHTVGITPVECHMRGQHMILRGHEAHMRGTHRILEAIECHMRGAHNIENTAVELYEHYYSAGSPPDMTGSPTETSASLPHIMGAITPTEGLHYIATQYRNRWGLASGPIILTIVELDGDGNQIVQRPSDPVNVEIEPAANAAARVSAEYLYEQDEDRKADTWCIYLTDDGSNPDPDVDEPTEVDVACVDGVARLDWTSAEFDDTDTIKVIVTLKRSSDARESEDETIHTTTASTSGPDTITVDVIKAFPGKR